MEQRANQISRRRLLVGTAAGTAAVWAAPAVSTLGSASAAGSDCRVFNFVSADLVSPTWHVSPNPTYGVGTILQTSQDKLLIANGDVDLVGDNTPWPTPTFPDKSIDLNGSSNKILTILSTNYSTPLSLPSGNYNVRLKVYGSIGPDTNIIGVHIGAAQAIGPAVIGAGSSSLHTLTGSVTGASGIIRLTHTSTPDNKGLFLVSLEVFAETC